MFHVHYDRSANILTLCVKGFWEPADVSVFAREVDTKARQAQAIRKDFNVLVDSLDFRVQANNVAESLTGVMRSGIALTTGRYAVVVGSQLARAQSERILVHPRVRIFLTLENAHHWLAEAA